MIAAVETTAEDGPTRNFQATLARLGQGGGVEPEDIFTLHITARRDRPGVFSAESMELGAMVVGVGSNYERAAQDLILETTVLIEHEAQLGTYREFVSKHFSAKLALPELAFGETTPQAPKWLHDIDPVAQSFQLERVGNG